MSQGNTTQPSTNQTAEHKKKIAVITSTYCSLRRNLIHAFINIPNDPMADQSKKADEFSLEEDDLFEDFELVSMFRFYHDRCASHSLARLPL